MLTALTNVRVFDGQRLTEPTTVVIDGPVIGDNSNGAQEVDAAGATLLPGLIDSHVHLSGPETLNELARWGVTTAFDMAFWPPELIKSTRQHTGGADFRTAGLPAIGPDGPHAKILKLPAEAIVLTPEDARRHVEARVAEGVDYIKGVAEAPGDGGPSQETLTALVEAAHEHGLKVVIHAATVGAYTVAVATKADFITHVPRNGVISPDDIAAMRANGQIDVPTMTVIESMAGPQDFLFASVAALREAGIEILAGTDAHATPGLPSRIAHGESLHHEFELLARAGLSPVEILRSATELPARAFGLTDRGRIAPGLRADLLLVQGDPTTDITATRNIRAVWRAGNRIGA
ncbi:amidohydrolase family protein [Kutzneria sp. CA-103260]|uniref:amidohydrolase family protein n=1 Tax=Kutzneria sp. CA-103260 TaxID=2802641 RepID=UPI001BAC714E|nr:amidohydrolase family protein [Kutzneria sp. CA-103260]QUQ62395.1 amidohydrolase [Kutzneria sp. CA-103260]